MVTSHVWPWGEIFYLSFNFSVLYFVLYVFNFWKLLSLY